jgi:hypothetical protein
VSRATRIACALPYAAFRARQVEVIEVESYFDSVSESCPLRVDPADWPAWALQMAAVARDYQPPQPPTHRPPVPEPAEADDDSDGFVGEPDSDAPRISCCCVMLRSG